MYICNVDNALAAIIFSKAKLFFVAVHVKLGQFLCLWMTVYSSTTRTNQTAAMEHTLQELLTYLILVSASKY